MTHTAMIEDMILAEVDGEGMIIDVENSTSYFLNETALLIFKMHKEKKSVHEIKTALLAEYDVKEKDAEKDIQDFLIKLERKSASWGQKNT